MRLSDDEDAHERIAAANQYNNNTLHFKTTQYGRTNTYVLAKRPVVPAGSSGGDDGSGDDGGGGGGGGGGGSSVDCGGGGDGGGGGSTGPCTTTSTVSRIPPYQAGRTSAFNTARNTSTASTTTTTIATTTTTTMSTNSSTSVPTYRRRLSACVGTTTQLGTQGDQLNLIKATRRRRITIVPTESTSMENDNIAINDQTSASVANRETIIHLTSPAAPAVISEPSAVSEKQPNVQTSPAACRAALRTPLPSRKATFGREETDGRTPEGNDAAATDEQRPESPNDALHPCGNGSPSSTVTAIECAILSDTSSEEVAGQQQQEQHVHAKNTGVGGRADVEPDPSSVKAVPLVAPEPNSPQQEPPPAAGSPPVAAPTPPPLACDVNGNTRAPTGSPVVVVPRPMTRAMLRKQLHSDATRTINHRGAVNNENQRGNRGDINSNVIIDETKRFKRTRSGNASECQKTKEKVRKLGLSGLAKGTGVTTKASAAPKAKVPCDARTGKQRSVDGTGGCGGVGGGTDGTATKGKVASIRSKR
uniref:Uncharacterized protein n=1 Tax=Anopheles farauti TaxID=69004 RepID=A0A182Q141_9DIPT